VWLWLSLFCLPVATSAVNQTDATPSVAEGVVVDVDASPQRDWAERREERRENLREAIDQVDSEVGDGGVQVDVDGE
jgi:hypothetical protein